MLSYICLMLQLIAASASCLDYPPNWADTYGYDCADYEYYHYCNANGTHGEGWLSDWGTIPQYSNMGYDGFQACCACGGRPHVAPSLQAISNSPATPLPSPSPLRIQSPSPSFMPPNASPSHSTSPSSFKPSQRPGPFSPSQRPNPSRNLRSSPMTSSLKKGTKNVPSRSPYPSPYEVIYPQVDDDNEQEDPNGFGPIIWMVIAACLLGIVLPLVVVCTFEMKPRNVDTSTLDGIHISQSVPNGAPKGSDYDRPLSSCTNTIASAGPKSETGRWRLPPLPAVRKQRSSPLPISPPMVNTIIKRPKSEGNISIASRLKSKEN